MSGKKVAVVTGANKGIGFAIVRGLCRRFDGDVYLTARDETRGKAAVADLQNQGLKPLFHQLDITDSSGIDTFAQFIKNKYGGLDILVNNAAVAFLEDSKVPKEEQVEVTMNTNFWGTLNVCNKLFPLLRSSARVVNVSSGAAQYALQKCSDERRRQILNLKNIDDLCEIMEDFTESEKLGKSKHFGYHSWDYGTSKLGVTALSILQQKQFDSDRDRVDIAVNSCCPGYVDTDMTKNRGLKTIDQGADTPLYLALLPRNKATPRGDFVSERKIVKWE